MTRTRKLAVGVAASFVVAAAAVIVRTAERDPMPSATLLRYLPGGTNAVIQIINHARSKLEFRCAAEYASTAPSPARGIVEPHEMRQVTIALPVGRPFGLLAVDFKTQSRLPNRVEGLLACLGIHTARPHAFQTNIVILQLQTLPWE